MKPGLHHLFVFGGLALGLTAGIFLIESEPAFLGWLFGSGAGLAGGAFAAALTSGEQIAGGSGKPTSSSRRTRGNPALRHWDQTASSSNGTHEHTSNERSRR